MSREDKDLEGFFDDETLVEDIASEVIDDANEEVAPVEEPTSTSVAKSRPMELGALKAGLDFSSLNALPGVVVGKTGIEVSRFPVERFKFTKGQKSLISILSDNVIVAKTHYDEDLGNFLCFGGACCDSDLARVRYVYPVLKYETNAKGKPISKEVRFGSLVLGQDQYDTIRDIEDLKGDITNFDLLISCSDEQYQKITIQEAGPARWHKIEGITKQIQEFWSENGKYILKSIAKKITPQEYAKAKSTEVTTGDDVDFDDVFGE